MESQSCAEAASATAVCSAPQHAATEPNSATKSSYAESGVSTSARSQDPFEDAMRRLERRRSSAPAPMESQSCAEAASATAVCSAPQHAATEPNSATESPNAKSGVSTPARAQNSFEEAMRRMERRRSSAAAPVSPTRLAAAGAAIPLVKAAVKEEPSPTPAAMSTDRDLEAATRRLEERRLDAAAFAGSARTKSVKVDDDASDVLEAAMRRLEERRSLSPPKAVQEAEAPQQAPTAAEAFEAAANRLERRRSLSPRVSRREAPAPTPAAAATDALEAAVIRLEGKSVAETFSSPPPAPRPMTVPRMEPPVAGGLTDSFEAAVRRLEERKSSLVLVGEEARASVCESAAKEEGEHGELLADTLEAAMRRLEEKRTAADATRVAKTRAPALPAPPKLESMDSVEAAMRRLEEKKLAPMPIPSLPAQIVESSTAEEKSASNPKTKKDKAIFDPLEAAMRRLEEKRSVGSAAPTGVSTSSQENRLQSPSPCAVNPQEECEGDLIDLQVKNNGYQHAESTGNPVDLEVPSMASKSECPGKEIDFAPADDRGDEPDVFFFPVHPLLRDQLRFIYRSSTDRRHAMNRQLYRKSCAPGGRRIAILEDSLESKQLNNEHRGMKELYRRDAVEAVALRMKVEAEIHRRRSTSINGEEGEDLHENESHFLTMEEVMYADDESEEDLKIARRSRKERKRANLFVDEDEYFDDELAAREERKRKKRKKRRKKKKKKRKKKRRLAELEEVEVEFEDYERARKRKRRKEKKKKRLLQLDDSDVVNGHIDDGVLRHSSGLVQPQAGEDEEGDRSPVEPDQSTVHDSHDHPSQKLRITPPERKSDEELVHAIGVERKGFTTPDQTEVDACINHSAHDTQHVEQPPVVSESPHSIQHVGDTVSNGQYPSSANMESAISTRVAHGVHHSKESYKEDHEASDSSSDSDDDSDDDDAKEWGEKMFSFRSPAVAVKTTRASSDSSESDEDSEDDEVKEWAAKMFSSRPSAANTRESDNAETPSPGKPVVVENPMDADTEIPSPMPPPKSLMEWKRRRGGGSRESHDGTREYVRDDKKFMEENNRSRDIYDQQRVLEESSTSESDASQSEASFSGSFSDTVFVEEKRARRLSAERRRRAERHELFSDSSSDEEANDAAKGGSRGADAALTEAEVRAILGDDNFGGNHQASSRWVRRSARQPNRSATNAKHVKNLVDKLHMNDADMVVLKLKKYLSDPDTPPVVIDHMLEALEHNTNCEALYVQNFNQGMKDEEVMHLLRVLQRPECNIWCLNIGETYNVQHRTWEKFARGLKKTKITHMYASEHTISTELKDYIRDVIRENRSKHNMHNDPNNLDVIIQCTHCWWNPINARVLHPYLKNQGYEHLLYDKALQGTKDAPQYSTVNGGYTGANP